MESDVRRSNAPAYVMMVSFGVTGIVCGYFAVVLAKAIPIFGSFAGNIVFYSIALLLWAVIALGLHSIIHEMGHLLFGLLSGYSFLSFRILSLALVKRKTGFGFCIQKVPGTLGQCLMTPPKDKSYAETPYKLYNLGGVIMTYITALICVIIMLFCKNSLAFALLIIFAIEGIFLAIENGFPFRNTVITNDGGNVRILSNSIISRKAFIAQLEIVDAITNGMRFKDMPIEWFTLPDDADKNSVTFAIRTAMVLRLMDECKIAEAQSLNYTLLTDTQIYNDLNLTSLRDAWLYYELVTGNIEKAEDIVEAFPKLPIRLSTKYAYILLCEDDEYNAELVREILDESANGFLNKGEIETERELMDYALDIFKRSQK